MNSQKWILYIDDDVDDCVIFRDSIVDAFPYVKVTTYIPNTEEDAIKYIRSLESLPDVLIIDSRFPLGDGRCVLERIQRDPNLRNINVVLLTTGSTQYGEYLKARCPELDDHILIKPISPEALEEFLEAA